MAAEEYTVPVDTTTYWRFGYIEQEAKAFGKDQFVRHMEIPAVNIRPGQSLQEIEKRLTEEYKVKIRLFIPKWAQ